MSVSTRICVILVLGVAAGCQQQTVEYHRRPGFYRLASDTELVDEYVDKDGKRIVFVEDGPLPAELEARKEEDKRKAEIRRKRIEEERRAMKAAGIEVPEEEDLSGEPKAFKGREEFDDGTIVLRAILPEHVLGHTITCLRNGEYQLLWDQMVSRDTKMAYAQQEMGVAEFAEFCQKNRSELMKMLNRMIFSYYSGSDVVLDRMQNLSVRIRFSAQLATQFTFKEVVVVQELEGMKLGMIR